MDTYDGLVLGRRQRGQHRAARPSAVSSGSARCCRARCRGPTRTATITVEPAYAQPWLPDLADTTGFGFTGPGGRAGRRRAPLQRRHDHGDHPRRGARRAALHGQRRRRGRAPASGWRPRARRARPTRPSRSRPLSRRSRRPTRRPRPRPSARSSRSPLYLRDNGRYSNGGGAQSVITAGHGAGRLTAFLEAKQIIGDDEQYAAAMALLANAVGVPARVSLDGTWRPDGAVYGKDVRADVELDTGAVRLGDPARQPVHRDQEPAAADAEGHTAAAPVKVVPPRRSDAAPVAAANSSSAVSRTTPPRRARVRHSRVVLILLKYAGTPLLVVVAAGAALIAARRCAAGAAAAGRPRRGWRAPGGSCSTSAVTWASRPAAAWRDPPGAGRACRGSGCPRPERWRRGRRGLFGPADPDDAAAAGSGRCPRGPARRRRPPRRWRRAWVAVNPASLWASRAALRVRGPPARSRPVRPRRRRGLAAAARARRPGAMAGGTHR